MLQYANDSTIPRRAETAQRIRKSKKGEDENGKNRNCNFR